MAEVSDPFQKTMLELNGLQSVKIKSLEKKLQAAEMEAESAERRYIQLEKDFAFNLKVIEERDRDIGELSQQMDSLRVIVLEKNKKIEELLEQTRVFAERNDYTRDENKALRQRITEISSENDKLHDQLEDSQNKEAQKIKEGIQAACQVKEEEIARLKNELAKLSQDTDEKVKNLVETKRQHEWSLQTQVEKLLEEKQRINGELIEQKMKIEEDKRKAVEEIAFQKKRNVEMQINYNNSTKEIEIVRGNQHNWQKLFEEKLAVANEEKEALKEKLVEQKAKWKRKFKEENEKLDRKLQEEREEWEFYTRQQEARYRELNIDKERVELEIVRLREIHEGREKLKNKEILQLEEKFKRFRKTQEDTLKQHLTDKNIIEFHFKAKAQEVQEIQDKLNAQIQDKESLTKDFEEIRAENQLLIAEIVTYRKKNNNQNNNSLNQNMKSKHDKKQVLNVSMNFEEDNMIEERKKREHQSRREHSVEDKLDSYEKLFSDDMGPASPMRVKNYNLEFLNNNRSASQLVSSIIAKNKLGVNILQGSNTSGGMQQQQQQFKQAQSREELRLSLRNNSRAWLADKVQQLESEVEAYKHLIETLAVEMEGVSQQMNTCKAEVERSKLENLELRSKQAELNSQILDAKERLLKSEKVAKGIFEKEEEIDSKEREIVVLKKSIERYRAEVSRLRAERNQLDAISADLEEQLRGFQQQSQFQNYNQINLNIDQEQRYQYNNMYYDSPSTFPQNIDRNSSPIKIQEPVREKTHPYLPMPEEDKTNRNQNKNEDLKSNPQANKVNKINYPVNLASQDQKKHTQQHSRHGSRSQSPEIIIKKQIKASQQQELKKAAAAAGGGGFGGGLLKNVPKYDNFMDIERLTEGDEDEEEDYKRGQIHRNQQDNENGLFLVSNQKPLLERQIQNVPNSQRATPSQLSSEQKMKEAGSRPSSAAKQIENNANNNQTEKDELQLTETQKSNKLKVRNYSLRDDQNSNENNQKEVVSEDTKRE